MVRSWVASWSPFNLASVPWFGTYLSTHLWPHPKVVSCRLRTIHLNLMSWFGTHWTTTSINKIERGISSRDLFISTKVMVYDPPGYFPFNLAKFAHTKKAGHGMLTRVNLRPTWTYNLAVQFKIAKVPWHVNWARKHDLPGHIYWQSFFSRHPAVLACAI